MPACKIPWKEPTHALVASHPAHAAVCSHVGFPLCLAAPGRQPPLLDGTLNRAGISAAAIIQRDHLGVVTIETGNRRDLAYALVFIHAQERFFQMDLLRRAAAGELAELVGSSMLSLDLNHRRHLFRKRAQAEVAALPDR